MAQQSSEAKPAGTPLWLRICVGIAVVVFLGATLWLALRNRSAAATVTGLCALGLASFLLLPMVDSLEVFGLKAKLRTRIDEADRLVEALKGASLLATKLLYEQIAWSGRMGTASWETKRKWAADLDASISALGVDHREVGEAKQQFLAFAAFDLYQVFDQMVRSRVRKSVAEVDKKLAALPNPMDAEAQERQRELLAEKRRIRAFDEGPKNLHVDDRLRRSAALVEDRLRHLPVSDGDREKLQVAGSRYAAVMSEIFNEGRVTDQAEALLRRHHDDFKAWQAEYEELFGEAPA